MDRFSAGSVIHTLDWAADAGKCPILHRPHTGLGRQVLTCRAAVPSCVRSFTRAQCTCPWKKHWRKTISKNGSLSPCTGESESGVHGHLENSGVENIILILAPPVPLINYVLWARCIKCLNILICRFGGGSVALLVGKERVSYWTFRAASKS